MRPALSVSGAFQVRSAGDHLEADPATYERYDPQVTAFTSPDTEAGARLYRQFHPLFVEAYRELGLPETFDETMAAALANLLSVDVPDGPMELESYDICEALPP